MADDPWTALVKAWWVPWHRLLDCGVTPPVGGLDRLAQQAVENGQSVRIEVGGWPDVEEDG